MSQDFNPSISAIENSFNGLNNYFESDIRLKERRSLLEPKINVLSFNKCINTSKGVREIHYINYNGSQIPMRLLSIKEERRIKQETSREFKKYPEFLGGENHPIFQEIIVIKTLSIATSVSPEDYETGTPQPFFTESEIEDMPPVAVNYLMKQYTLLDREYNLEYNQSFEDDIDNFLMTIFDGVPMNEKKLSLLSGLTSGIRLQIIIRLCNALTKLEDNAQFITLLEGWNQSESDGINHKETENNISTS